MAPMSCMGGAAIHAGESQTNLVWIDLALGLGHPGTGLARGLEQILRARVGP